MKSVLITTGSLVLSSIVIANAYYQKKQFYPSVVYIIKSSPSMAVSNLRLQFTNDSQCQYRTAYAGYSHRHSHGTATATATAGTTTAQDYPT